MSVALLATVAAAVHLQAAPVIGHSNDFEPRIDLRTFSNEPGPSRTAPTLRVGFQTNFKITTALFFQLPLLQPGERITDASLDLTLTPETSTAVSTTPPNHNGDLYALGIASPDPEFSDGPRNDAAAGAQYYFVGEADPNPEATLIQDNFLVSGFDGDFVPNGAEPRPKSSDALGDTNLLNYVNLLYANQQVNGFIPGSSFLVLRINPDFDDTTPGTHRFTVASGDNGTPEQRPMLNLTIVPEPSSTLLLLSAVSGLGLLARRRG